VERRFRKALFAIARDASDVADLRARFDAFIEGVRDEPPGLRPYPDEVRDTLQALSFRPELATELHRRYLDARVGRERQPA
jgi:hypothetical protein